MLSSTIHGNETGGFILLLRFTDYMLSHQYQSIVKLLVDSLDIWINPNANPDGTYFDSLDIWQATRFNANGVDLNRNFPDPIMGKHPDGNPFQPETYAMMMQIMKKYRFVLSANFHSGEEVVNYPWDSQKSFHSDNNWFRTIAKEYADSAITYGPYNYFNTIIGNETIKGITNGYAWYPIYGGRQDYITFFRQGRELTIEIDKNYITPESNLETLWQANYRSIIQLLSHALTGVKGTISDCFTQLPIKGKIEIMGIDTMEASKVYSDSLIGQFVRLLLPGSYTIQASAVGYQSSSITISVDHVTLTPMHFSLCPLNKAMLNQNNNHLYIYPNPVDQYLNIQSKNLHNITTINIYSLEGCLFISARNVKNNINVSNLLPGLYIIKIEYVNGEKKHLKFVKQ